ncbi:MAG: type I phosphomannose isomerase catalytic subunit [Thermoguttaceae bacterium]|jgi:mannose-6-phosphate isomerase
MDPLVFEPYCRPQVWGGRRLQQQLNKPLPAEGTFGEAWEISAQSLHVSRVAEGPLAGMRLTELWATRAAELVGNAAHAPAEFPLLVKYLDCQELLSIQVHPNDEIARRLGCGQFGKTEAWIVMEAAPEGLIYAGFRPGVQREDVERRLADGTLAQCLHSFAPCKGDVVFLAAGTVHAVGGGVLMAEIQQSSDATFRLFDWNRPGSDGKPRPLHKKEALMSIDWSAGPVAPVKPGPLQGLAAGAEGERLVTCDYFSIDRLYLRSSLDLPHPQRLSIWMVPQGAAELASAATGYRRTFSRGATVLVPASAQALRWTSLQNETILLRVESRESRVESRDLRFEI